MPASLFADMEGGRGAGGGGGGGGGLEDQRALQLAFELSMLGFTDVTTASVGGGAGGGGPGGGGVVADTPSGTVVVSDAAHHLLAPPPPTTAVAFPDDARCTAGKKSQNMTECVPVPSSEHVAEIVGRQGCKIKALRAKTNTYIKTPVRGEEPVFVVTGRKEDVAKAKREILSAAEHFSQIRASRKSNLGGGGGGGSGSAPPGPPAAVPGHVTIQVRVPYRVVGLVVGPKGATIKRIQHQTHTYIVTPSRDKEPVFEVTGLPDSVETARREIEAHIAMRTGGGAGGGGGAVGVGGGHGPLAGVGGGAGGGVSVGSLVDDSPDLLASLYKSGLGSLFNYLDGAADAGGIGFPGAGGGMGGVGVGGGGVASSVGSSSSGAFSSCSSSSSSSSGGGGRLGDLVSIWGSSAGSVGGGGGPGSGGGGSIDRDEGLGDSPSFETAPTSIWSYSTGLTARPSPAASVSPDSAVPPSTPAPTVGSGAGGGSGASSSSGRRDCVVCAEREVDAALVPCGHNLFCLDCASHVCERGDALCPACQLPVAQAIRIFS